MCVCVCVCMCIYIYIYIYMHASVHWNVRRIHKHQLLCNNWWQPHSAIPSSAFKKKNSFCVYMCMHACTCVTNILDNRDRIGTWNTWLQVWSSCFPKFLLSLLITVKPSTQFLALTWNTASISKQETRNFHSIMWNMRFSLQPSGF